MSETQSTTECGSSSHCSKSALTARIVSGSIGSILTSLIVTPLEVVKVRTQTEPGAPSSSASSVARDSTSSSVNQRPPPTTTAAASTRTSTTFPRGVIPCPRGCGTFVLFNGQMECTLSKSSVPYFDHVTGQLLRTPAVSSNLYNHPASSSSSSSLGTFAMVRRIFAQEGLPGIYAGLRPTLVMAVPNTVLYFSAYEEIVWRLRTYGGRGEGTPSSYWLYPMVAGASARLVSSTLTAPFEFLRTRQAASTETSTRPHVSLWQEFRYIVQNEGGASALYSGLRSTLWRDVPFSAIYWLSVEQCKRMWKMARNRTNSSSGPLYQTVTPLEEAGQAFVNGAISGMIAAACTTPFDVVKTRQQVGATGNPAVLIAEGVCSTQLHVGLAGADCKHDGAIVYEVPPKATSSPQRTAGADGTFHLLREIAANEGIAGLWRGNQARMLKVAPGCAIMISSYEFGKRILE